MLRTIISLDTADKAWLDHEAKTARASMTEIVRKAIHLYREVIEERRNKPNMLQLLKKTKGSWKQGDGLAYQQKLRAEWDK